MPSGGDLFVRLSNGKLIISVYNNGKQLGDNIIVEKNKLLYNVDIIKAVDRTGGIAVCTDMYHPNTGWQGTCRTKGGR